MLRYAPIATSTNFPESLKEDFGTTPSTKLTILINNVLVNTTDTGETTISDDKELAYFQEKVRQMEHKDKEKSRGLTWKDAFRKREMPEFHYTPRFQNMPDAEAKPADTAEQRLADAKERNIRIKRRFDVNRTFQRKQQSVWIKVAVVLMIFYLVYRYYGAITQYIYNLFF